VSKETDQQMDELAERLTVRFSDAMSEVVREEADTDWSMESIRLTAMFDEAITHITRAMKLLAANGIMPQRCHQGIALAWAKGQMSDEQFISLARVATDIDRSL
jgi:hypothetical protein